VRVRQHNKNQTLKAILEARAWGDAPCSAISAHELREACVIVLRMRGTGIDFPGKV